VLAPAPAPAIALSAAPRASEMAER
jgi:hypothetical protein